MKINIKCKLIFINILILICLILLCGCTDKNELSDISGVVGLAIDKMPGSDSIRVTVEIASPGADSNRTSMAGTMTKRNTSVIEISTGKSINDAIQNFSRTSSLIIDFSHTKVVILSKSLCESGISEAIDFINRDRQLRSRTWILVANKTGKEILESSVPNGNITSMDIDDMMVQLRKNGTMLPVDLNTFVIESNSESKSSFAPIVDIEKSQSNPKGIIKVENTAIFKDNRYLGALTSDESNSLLWLYDYSKGHVNILPFKSDKQNQGLEVDVYKKSSKIIPYKTQNGFKFKIICTGYGVIREVQNISIAPQMVNKIEANTENILKNQLTELIETSQKRYNTDFIGFSKKIYNNYPQKWLHMKDNWYKTFPDTKYNIDVKINLTNIGMINDSPVPNDKEEEPK